MAPRINLSHKGFILIAVPLVFELVFVATLFELLMRAKDEAWRESSARQTVVLTNELGKLSFDASSALVTFALTKNKAFEERFVEIVRKIREDVHSLKTRVIDDPPRVVAAMRIEFYERTILDLLAQAKEQLSNVSGLGNVLSGDRARRLQAAMSKLLTEINRFGEAEGRLVSETYGAQSRSETLVYGCLSAGVVLNILLAFGLAIFFNKGTAKRLGILMDNTMRLAGSKELHLPLAGDDELAHLDSVFHDMARALAEALRKERVAVENAVDVICFIGSDGCFLAVNPAVLDVWGYRQDELLGHSYVDLVEADSIEKTRLYFADVREGKAAAALENCLVKSDGSDVDMSWSSHWSEQEQAFFCVVHDITERKKLDRLKREFVAMVSHDLRSPLNSVKALLTLLSEGAYGNLSSAGQVSVTATEQDVERLIAMINDLLDIEKMESGRLELHFKKVALVDLLWRAAGAISSFAESCAVNIKVIPCKVEIVADEERLIQVVVNLISNAVKFSPPETTVVLSVDELADSVVVKVADKGRGIPRLAQQAVFERFKQVDKSDGVGHKGSGLGLAICKAIVEQHGGEIGVDSEEGKGSTFWFRVPRQQPEHQS